MNFKLTSLKFSDGRRGQYIISPYVELESELINWISNSAYSQYTSDNLRMQRHTRKRNKLYSFDHPLLNKEVILKVSHIDKNYKLLRRINLLLSTFFTDYNLRAFKGGVLLNEINVDSAIPIAYWNESTSLFDTTSYYMYEKINADHTLFSFSELLAEKKSDSSDLIYKELADKVVHIIKKIHSAGFRQGDPHPGNFLVAAKSLNPNNFEIDEVKMHIIDLDKFNRAKPVGKTLKRFFDLRCMRRCTLGPYKQEDLLKIYLQEEYSSLWKYVVYFWMRGGFNPYKWFKKPKRGR